MVPDCRHMQLQQPPPPRTNRRTDWICPQRSRTSGSRLPQCVSGCRTRFAGIWAALYGSRAHGARQKRSCPLDTWPRARNARSRRASRDPIGSYARLLETVSLIVAALASSLLTTKYSTDSPDSTVSRRRIEPFHGFIPRAARPTSSMTQACIPTACRPSRRPVCADRRSTVDRSEEDVLLRRDCPAIGRRGR